MTGVQTCALPISQALPDIPTVAEAGYPGYEANSWNGIVAPAGTPRAIIEKLNAESNRALKHPDIAASLTSQVLDPLPSTPEEFAQRIKVDFEKYGKLIRAAAVKVD